MYPETGIKQGLHILGGEEEIGIGKKFSEHFLITFSRESTFKKSVYTFLFLKPPPNIKDKFNLSNEVLLLMSRYKEFDARFLDFVDKTLQEYDNRLDKICLILVSKDPHVEEKIQKLNNDNKDSRIIIPFTYKEALEEGFGVNSIENKLRKFFFERDLFAVESPLKTEAYFYGRNKVVHNLYDKFILGQNTGLFGLRKIGKTSVLFALERLINLRNEFSVYFDCQDTSVHKLRWYELLHKILENINKKYELKVDVPSIGRFNEKTASQLFEDTMFMINDRTNGKRILLIFDEIEHISFNTSSSKEWREDNDFIYFWQSVRAISQRNPNLYTCVIAGVNPLCVETPVVNSFDNPIFGLIKPLFLDLFRVEDVTEMVSNIGGYMGLKFEQEVFTDLTDNYGGHPFLIRHVCSLINSSSPKERPCDITKFTYRSGKKKYDLQIQNYIELIISVLKNWYSEEYKLLETLVRDGSDKFKEKASVSGNVITHLIGYGIIKEDKGKYYVNIEAVHKYIKERVQRSENLSTIEGKQQEISIRRNELEEKLRKVILLVMKANYGDNASNRILKSLKKEDEYSGIDIRDIIKEKLFFLNLKSIILQEWAIFSKIFGDRNAFYVYSSYINKERIDAHSKDITDEEFGLVMIAFKWFDERLNHLL